MIEKPELKRGWTTGSCATAAAVAAFCALAEGAVPTKVVITLPRGETVEFNIERLSQSTACGEWAEAMVIKDAGDDPDVTHGARIVVKLWWGVAGSGISFRAGNGVGLVTRPGLALAVGEPAINPVPRMMITQNLVATAARLAVTRALDLVVEVAVVDGERLAEQTLNSRLGIVGGLSILGTTGIVIPYSCSAWIHSIQRGVDVAVASGARHIAATTGRSSERAIQVLYGLPDFAMIEMGDFVGGFLKYLRQNPATLERIQRITIGGGLGKMVKLAQGNLDLHSKRSRVDFAQLSQWLREAGIEFTEPQEPPTAAAYFSALAQTNPPAADGLRQEVSRRAVQIVRDTLDDPNAPLQLEVLIPDIHRG
ncbi:MAG: cobalt-precorrin-5B (C(1))-methyltransferase [Candidatus Pacebacteria bacterium]|nr:cobalt-precorrin-5B (C(1))-methyltransferase [Candidatus Paceibacterota bacterium]